VAGQESGLVEEPLQPVSVARSRSSGGGAASGPQGATCQSPPGGTSPCLEPLPRGEGGAVRVRCLSQGVPRVLPAARPPLSGASPSDSSHSTKYIRIGRVREQNEHWLRILPHAAASPGEGRWLGHVLGASTEGRGLRGPHPAVAELVGGLRSGGREAQRRGRANE